MSKLILTTPEELQELIRVTLIDVLIANYKGNNLTNEKEILNTDQAAEYLSIAKQTLYQKTSASQIPHYKQGKKLYFKKNELEDWLCKHKRQTIEEGLAEYNAKRHLKRK